MTAEICVLLAAYNGRLYIEQQVDSILAQTGANLCLHILDDRSTDGTWEFLQERYAGDSRISLERNERNLGCIGTFERLLGGVNTPYFALADQDDVWMPEKLARTLAILRASDADLAYCDMTVVGEDLAMIATSKWRYSNTPPIKGCDPVPLLIKHCINGCTMVGRASLIKRLLPFPAGLPMHDRWLGAVACTGRGIVYDPEPLMSYRLHGGNVNSCSRFGLNGLRDRAGREGRGRIRAYAAERLAKRAAMVEALLLRDPGRHRAAIAFLRMVLTSPRLLRLAFAPAYVVFLLFRARSVGLKNIAADLLLTLAG